MLAKRILVRGLDVLLKMRIHRSTADRSALDGVIHVLSAAIGEVSGPWRRWSAGEEHVCGIEIIGISIGSACIHWLLGLLVLGVAGKVRIQGPDDAFLLSEKSSGVQINRVLTGRPAVKLPLPAASSGKTAVARLAAVLQGRADVDRSTEILDPIQQPLLLGSTEQELVRFQAQAHHVLSDGPEQMRISLVDGMTSVERDKLCQWRLWNEIGLLEIQGEAEFGVLQGVCVDQPARRRFLRFRKQAGLEAVNVQLGAAKDDIDVLPLAVSRAWLFEDVDVLGLET